MVHYDPILKRAEAQSEQAFDDTKGLRGDELVLGISNAFEGAEQVRLAKLSYIREEVIPNLPASLRDGVEREFRRTRQLGESHLVNVAEMALDAIDIAEIIHAEFECRRAWVEAATPEAEAELVTEWQREGKLELRAIEELWMGITGENVEAYLADLDR